MPKIQFTSEIYTRITHLEVLVGEGLQPVEALLPDLIDGHVLHPRVETKELLRRKEVRDDVRRYLRLRSTRDHLVHGRRGFKVTLTLNWGEGGGAGVNHNHLVHGTIRYGIENTGVNLGGEGGGYGTVFG